MLSTDCQLFEMLPFGMGKVLFKMAFWDEFDRVPAYVNWWA